MPWYFPWSDYIKKRACRYILDHYIGQYLRAKLSVEQLSLDVYEGKGRIKDVELDIKAVNEALEVGAKNPSKITLLIFYRTLVSFITIMQPIIKISLRRRRSPRLNWWMASSETLPSPFHGAPSWKAASLWKSRIWK